MKKIIAITVAALLFLASLATNIYYLVDGDSTTNPNVSEVVEKGKAVYNAATATDATASTTATAQ